MYKRSKPTLGQNKPMSFSAVGGEPHPRASTNTCEYVYTPNLPALNDIFPW